MGLLLILPILVSGYLFCNGSVYRQATMSRYDGQLLYMLIAKTGTIFFAVACLTSFWLMYVSKDGSLATTLGERSDYIKFIKDFLITNEIANNAEAPIWAFLAQASVISLILSWLSPRFFMLLLMLRHWASLQAIKGLILASKVPTRPLTKQLLTSMRDSKNLYMFSMADRKVYVGRVAHIGDLHEAGGMDEDFEIVPTMSGYRDKDTLKVTYTTDYSAVVDEMVRTGRKVGFSIVLSQKNIVSMSRYEDEIWNRFKLRQDVAENAKEGMLVRLAKLLEKL
ncbi:MULTISPECIES: hypothetical protein [Pseudomonas syringae group]|uniref:hypothetical protein n=1 Tax=Pseudomonas syringae group TaxID=136849 RepID=UPI000A2650BF|nr:hypothetical protein [Pseudomonas syringae]MBL3635551.1 hypothetical protein [Pseudomonas syringae pv. actinidiae]MDU8584070.1 hypothetical protein [Pseudomonas syringae pv. actinidiae]OSR90179.1 hypothetical protein BV329_00328 [Pseudomonas syringae pv. actinidiae]PYD04428.1 hypothetical protein DND90_09240 [Pseudomonas syringae pv. maculicola]